MASRPRHSARPRARSRARLTQGSPSDVTLAPRAAERVPFEEAGALPVVELSIALWVALGGALGSVARYLVSGWAARAWGETFPWGTLVVNVTGSFLIGLVAVLTGPDGRLLWPPAARQFVMVGVFGGFTTFSSFSLEAWRLLERGDIGLAGLYVGLSVAVSLMALVAGVYGMRWVLA